MHGKKLKVSLNVKPSELPLYTVIEFEDQDWVKADTYYGIKWQTLRCVDCQAGDYKSDKEADELFKKFKILALPFTALQYMAVDAVESEDNDFTQDFLIKDAIKHHLDEASVKKYI
jgi:hypothetical protein